MDYSTKEFLNHREVAKEKKRLIIEIKCKEHEMCPICLDEMYGKIVCHTPCGHRFHGPCLRKQLEIQHEGMKTCAMCRYNLVICSRDCSYMLSKRQFTYGLNRSQTETERRLGVEAQHNSMPPPRISHRVYVLMDINDEVVELV